MILKDLSGYGYETEALSREFFPGRELCLADKGETPAGDFIETDIRNGKAEVRVSFGGRTEAASEPVGEKPKEDLERLLYRALSDATGKTPPWGILTGVRPVKLLFKYLDRGLPMDAALGEIARTRLVTAPKLRLLEMTAESEAEIRKDSGPMDFSMYISVPFCPTRCSYCSFTAEGIEKAGKLIPEYVRLLCEEIAETAKVTRKLGLRLRTVYMGGGTPTTLSARQIETVFSAVRESFGTDDSMEMTVEAGRPDTITEEKLIAIKNSGARRISINPQTMNDAVLKKIGRKHSADDILEAFALARKLGFDDINMDLISGLPGDTEESFMDSVSKVLELGPENITLHTLTLKKGSVLRNSEDRENLMDVGIMNSRAYERFLEAGYVPYYLYRQKGTIDNLENVGFCRKGFECRYNVYIMDETHSVISCGAGGSTILKDPVTGHIEREYNMKFPFEYIERFGGIEEKKRKILDFYGNKGE